MPTPSPTTLLSVKQKVNIPIGLLTQPEDIARAILDLSDLFRSESTTGQALRLLWKYALRTPIDLRAQHNDLTLLLLISTAEALSRREP